MSKFSEKCKEYISRSNRNVYQIAKFSGLERTMIQRMVSGSRLPDINAVKLFCKHIQITKMEEEELLELYKMEKVGKDTYYARQEVEKLLSGIQQLRRGWNDLADYQRMMSPAGTRKDPHIRPLKFEVDIMEAIQYAVQKEIDQGSDARIDMDLFPKCEYVMQQLIRKEKGSHRSITCNQYVNFMRASCNGSAIENIRMLRTIIPFAFTLHHNYNVLYSYTTTEQKDNYNRLWPHFLITGGCLILLSENMQRGLLIENEEIIRQYREELEMISRQYRPLFEKTSTGGNQIDMYFEKKVVKFPDWVYEGHICVRKMFYPELVKRERDNPYATMLITRYDEQQRAKEKEDSCYISSLGGLEELAKTGKFPGIYGQFSRTYTVEERKKMLKYYVEELKEKDLKVYLPKDPLLLIDEGISIEMFGGKEVSFISTSSEFPFGMVTISESNIYAIFQDYFESLIKDGRVWSIEETKKRIEEQIRLLWTQQGWGEW